MNKRRTKTPKRLESPHFRIVAGGQRVAYAYIRKNACSAWKKLFEGESRHRSELDQYDSTFDFMMRRHRIRHLDPLSNFPNRVVVLRDPVDRAVSAFINQFILRLKRGSDLIDESLGVLGGEAKNVSFRRFALNYVAQMQAVNINGHLMPQDLHLAPIEYTHVWPLDHLYEGAESLFGKTITDRYFRKRENSTRHIPRHHELDADSTAETIFEKWKGGDGLPSRESLLTEEILAALKAYYSEDDKLFNAALAEFRQPQALGN